jgi:predicted RNase H-like nuclease (RuvC/YqgF family)
MSSHTDGSSSYGSPSIKKSLSPIKEAMSITGASIEDNVPLKSAEELAAEEAEAARVYCERKSKAKKKRDEKQQREVQRIMEEKRQVEEELDELRASSAQQMNSNGNVSSSKEGDVFNSSSGNNLTSNTEYLKKLNKMKKKYEKKIQSMSDDMNDLRDVSCFFEKWLITAI